jgi:phospholipase C
MSADNRRIFLKHTAAGLTAGALPLPISRALALPAGGKTGTIMDVEHVVILMQENRSFDHYFGMLRGVRGFSDPRPLILPSGRPIWYQPGPDGEAVTPFRLDSKTSAAQSMVSLDHSWKGSQARWNNHDAWIAAKGPMTMGHFTREDLPFYYALADAFTICDAYHCSLFGPTNPNRLFLFSGTNGLAAGNNGLQAIENPTDEPNETADPRNDAAAFKPYGWTTYAERLQAAGIDWRVYQEYDNYGDNGLAYFARFRGLDPNSELYDRARGWAATSNAANTKQSRGEHLLARFEADVAGGRLPQVSWIVAPYILSEHPAACPAYGEQLTARLIGVLAAHPDVWAKTVFILNYDENDGFFDHVPPPVPPIRPGMGKSSMESYHGEAVGLGPRVPMLIVSPWTKGGFEQAKNNRCLAIKHLTRRRGSHAARTALKQLHTQLFFQLVNLVGKGGLGYMNSCGGAGEASSVHNRYKIAYLTKLHWPLPRNSLPQNIEGFFRDGNWRLVASLWNYRPLCEFSVQARPYLFSTTKVGQTLFADRHGIPTPRIAAHAGRPLPYRKRTKAPKLNAPTTSQRIHNSFKYRINNLLGVPPMRKFIAPSKQRHQVGFAHFYPLSQGKYLT